MNYENWLKNPSTKRKLKILFKDWNEFLNGIQLNLFDNENKKGKNKR